MDNPEPILSVSFFKSETGREPAREWLKSLPREHRRIIGEDIKTVQFGWPLGMPLVRKLDRDLWEVRIRLPDGIARVMFTAGEGRMILLHGFIKKSQKTPADDLALAKTRLHLLQ
jgi:phage-related protein